MKKKENTFTFEPQLYLEEATQEINPDGINLIDLSIEFCIQPEKQKEFILKLKNFLISKCKLEHFQVGHLIEHWANDFGIIHSYPNLWILQVNFIVKTSLSINTLMIKIETLMKGGDKYGKRNSKKHRDRTSRTIQESNRKGCFNRNI